MSVFPLTIAIKWSLSMCSSNNEKQSNTKSNIGKLTGWLEAHLPMLLSSSLSFLYWDWRWSAWFSNIWILRDWICDWTRTNSCMHFIAFVVWRFTFWPLTTPCSLTRPLSALKLLLAYIEKITSVNHFMVRSSGKIQLKLESFQLLKK